MEVFDTNFKYKTHSLILKCHRRGCWASCADLQQGLLYASMGKADMAVTSTIPRPTVRVDQQPNPELIPPSGVRVPILPKGRETQGPGTPGHLRIR